MTTPAGNGSRRRGRGVRALIPDLADGSHQGNVPCMRCRDDDTTIALLATEGKALAENLERATTLLRQLEQCLARTGGYMSPEDQDALRAARALLVDLGK